jgi:hypothetical protein
MYDPDDRLTPEQPSSERALHVRHVHHVLDPVVWLLPPPEGSAQARGHRLRRGRHRAAEAAQIVEKANNGNQTVPTLVFADGTALTNPSLAQIKAQLAS